MNKQELIETLEELKEHAKHSTKITKYKSCWQGKTEAYVNVLGLAKQLDEPQKPVVPKFVEDWIKDHMDMGKYVCLEIFMCQYNNIDLPTDLYNYYDTDRDGSRDKVINAILYGYEVEKEPLYYVKLPFEVWDEEAAELKTEFRYLGYDLTSDETRMCPTKKPWKDFATKLDEITIKSADERYWPFAVPVEEMAEG